MESRGDKNISHGPPAPGSGRDATVVSRERFCDYLIAAREQSGKSLDDIAGITRIPIRSLERLETGEFERLPADVFVRGFLRSYARCVGLSEEETIRRYGECGMTPAPVASAMADELSDSLATLDSSPPPSYRVRRASTRSETDAPRMAAATPATGTPAAVTPAGATSAAGTPAAIPAVGTDRVTHQARPAAQPATRAVEPARPVDASQPGEDAQASQIAAAPQETLPAGASRTSMPAPAAAPLSPAAAPLSRNARKRKRKNRKRKRQAGSSKNVILRESRAAAQDANEAVLQAEASELDVSAESEARERIAAMSSADIIGSTPADESLNALSDEPASEASGSATVAHARPGDSARKRMPRPVLVIDDDDPEQAERIREEREAAKEREDATWRTFLPPSLLDSEEGSRRGALTLAVIILVIVATLTMSYLMRRPNDSGDGVTRAPGQLIDRGTELAWGQDNDRGTEHVRGTERLS